jgi:type VI secretion system secreted protein Hcp
MPVRFFLELDGIQGESTDAKHPGAIELDSFGFGLAQQVVTSGSGGSSAGKASFHDLHFVALTSKASPKLFLACASGQHVADAVLTCRRAGGAQQEFLVVGLTDVLVTSYELEGEEDDVAPIDRVTLHYGTIQIEYRAQKADGSLQQPVKAGWNLVTNKKL